MGKTNEEIISLKKQSTFIEVQFLGPLREFYVQLILD